jgi:hypothetical protein
LSKLSKLSKSSKLSKVSKVTLKIALSSNWWELEAYQ